MKTFRGTSVAILLAVPGLWASEMTTSSASAVPAPALSVASAFTAVQPGAMIVGDSSVITVAGSGAEASVEEQVWKSATGTYDFLFQITNLSSSSNALTLQLGQDFSSATAVGYLHTSGVTPSISMTSGGGNAPGFSLANASTAALQPGAKSDWLEIDTDAQIFSRSASMGSVSGSALLLSGFFDPGIQANVAAQTAVPEPGTYAFMLGGMFVIGAIRYRKNRKS